MLDEASKKNLTRFGIFVGIFVFLTGILVFSILMTKDTKNKFLAQDIQNVLNTYEPNSYIVGQSINLKSTFSTSAAAYSILKVGMTQNETYVGIVVRIPTLFGHMPAVFICKNGTEVSFAGYALDNGKARDIEDTRLSNGIMNYWKKTIPIILAKTEGAKND